MKKKKSDAWLSEYIRCRKWHAFFFIMVTVAISFVAPFKSFIIQWLIDASSKRQALLYLCAGGMIVVLGFLLELLSRNLGTKLECESIRTIRGSILRKALEVDMQSYLQGEASPAISTLTNDMKILHDDFFQAFYTIFLYGGMLFFAICMYIYINPSLLIFVVFASIIPLVVPRLFDKGLQNSREKHSEEMGRYLLHVSDIFSGFETIHLFEAANGFSEQHDIHAQSVASLL